jgi:hypothetical protein
MNGLLGYWKLNEAYSNYISDYAENPSHTSLFEFGEECASWRFVDEAFPMLPLYDQTPISINQFFKEPISLTRTLISDTDQLLSTFTTTGYQTLELWVISYSK